MSIASKLKDLVIKWGGQPTKDDDSIEELIALLTELDAPSGGSGGIYFLTPVDVSYSDRTGTFTQLSISESYNDIVNKLNKGIEVAIILHGIGELTGIEDTYFLSVIRAAKGNSDEGYAVYFNDPANSVMLFSMAPDDPMSKNS